MTNYHYTECGLDNVLIEGMDFVVDDAGDEVYKIINVNGLHKCIAHALITQDYGLNPKELKFLRTEMGLTQAELAEILKKDSQSIGRWERGEHPIDETAEVVIRLVAEERLGLDIQMTVEEVAKLCVPSAVFKEILIDGSNPKKYKAAA